MALRGGRSFEQAWDARRQLKPMRRYGLPEEFSAQCASLFSAHACYIKARILLADGGTHSGML